MMSLADRSRLSPAVAPEDHAVQFAQHLLTSVELVAAKRVYRFAELECYVSSGQHPDPFSHRHPLQKEQGRWYLHRTGNGYRAGSFKGIDFTLGDSDVYIGVLLRTLIDDAGQRIEGPSKIVDHLMSEFGARSLTEWDRMLGTGPFWDACGPLHIRDREASEQLPIYRGPRVGLSLKRLAKFPAMPQFLGKPYRFLTNPRQTRRGRPGLAIGLYQQGHSAKAISDLTGLSPRVIEAYLGWFEEGRAQSLATLSGRKLAVRDHCRLLGCVSCSDRFP